MTRIPCDLADCVSFARWCALWRIDPSDAAELCAWPGAPSAPVQRHCNAGLDSTHRAAARAQAAVAARAVALGFAADWPGLFPRLRRDGSDVYLPSICDH